MSLTSEPTTRGKLYTISAPSGAGKTSLVRRINRLIEQVGSIRSHTPEPCVASRTALTIILSAMKTFNQCW